MTAAKLERLIDKLWKEYAREDHHGYQDHMGELHFRCACLDLVRELAQPGGANHPADPYDHRRMDILRRLPKERR